MTQRTKVERLLAEALDREEERLVALAVKHGDAGPGSVGLLIDLTNVHGSFEVIRAALASLPTPDYEAFVEKARLVSQWHGALNTGPPEVLDAELGELRAALARLREGEPA